MIMSAVNVGVLTWRSMTHFGREPQVVIWGSSDCSASQSALLCFSSHAGCNMIQTWGCSPPHTPTKCKAMFFNNVSHSLSPPGFLCSLPFMRSASTVTQSQSSSSVCKTTQSTCEGPTWGLVNGWKLGKTFKLELLYNQRVYMKDRLGEVCA